MTITELTEEIEKVSSGYTKKFDIQRDKDWFLLKLQEEMGELVQAYLMYSKRGRSKGKSPEEIKHAFDQEVADVLCHVLLLAKHTDVDLEKHIKDKWLQWNK